MAKKVVMVLGVVFIVVGLLGFVNDPVLGLFEVNMVHNLIHLVSGILAVLFAVKGESSAKSFAKVFGVIYGLVAILGLVTSGDTVLGIEINMADDILHVVLALVFLYVGFSKSSAPSMEAPQNNMENQSQPMA